MAGQQDQQRWDVTEAAWWCGMELGTGWLISMAMRAKPEIPDFVLLLIYNHFYNKVIHVPCNKYLVRKVQKNVKERTRAGEMA